jgi:FkbM family methyltransferase
VIVGKRLARRVLPAYVLGRIRAARTGRLIAGYSPRTVQHTYGGFPLTVSLRDPLAAGWYDHDWPALPEVDILRTSRLQPGSRVFDLGAHQGVVALVLQRIVGESGRVIALEANAHNAGVAEENRVLNGATQLTVIHAAAAREPGTLTFNEALNGKVDSGNGAIGRRRVAARSVDDLAAEFGVPDVLFLDVEGYEYEVLCGASHVLATTPDCFVEVHTGCGLESFGATVSHVLAFFPRDRYRLYVGAAHGGGGFHELAAAEPLPAERFHLVALSR